MSDWDKDNKDMFEADTVPIRKVAETGFPMGFRGDFLDMRKFRRCYEQLYDAPCAFDDEQIKQTIYQYGIEHKEKYYIPEDLLPDELKKKLFDYIEQQFNEGKARIYFTALFDKFADDFLMYQMYDADMLKEYIGYFTANQYFIGRDYLAKEKDTALEPIVELRTFLKDYGLPIRIDDICKKLPNLPENKIRELLGSNLEFVRNSKGEYFHADALDLTDEELKNIIKLIADEVKVSDFISGNELYEAIKSKYPDTFEKNKIFSVIGWRDALKYRLADSFSFSGSIISAKDKALSMSEVFSIFARNRQKFTLAEVEQFAQNVGAGSVIYFAPLYTYAARISRDEFVRKDNVHFQVAETDKVLARFCPGDYIALKQIDNFGIFPDASYPWNPYLLESYLASAQSEHFDLQHGDFNKNHVAGAMVKKGSHIDNFDELLTRVIADSKVDLQKEAALNYLAEQGYIARRSYSKIEQVLLDARARRNRKDS